MLIPSWWRRSVRPTPSSFRPSVCVLEDRTVPSGFRQILPPRLPPPAPATHFEVTVPANVQTGQSIDVVVKAEDGRNQMATSYTGTIHLALSAVDAGAKLPASYTFTANDHGVHVFHMTLTAAGSQVVSAASTTGSIKGSVAVTVNAAATHFMVLASASPSTGYATTMTVQALDVSNHPVSGYTGTVHFTSTDGNAILPGDYTFQLADHGIFQFSVIFNTVGSQTLTVTDSANLLKGSLQTRIISSNSLWGDWSGYWNGGGNWNPYWYHGYWQ